MGGELDNGSANPTAVLGYHARFIIIISSSSSMRRTCHLEYDVDADSRIE